ncbi:UNVERIFIED_CONTAM: hypothetical protein FKN15_038528 [Acipenser sinensis]
MFSDLTAQKGATLLAPPALEGPVFDRVCPSSYNNCSERFKLGERSFSRQYAHIYATRLLQMRPVLTKRAQQHNLLPQPPRAKYISQSDELILEDELQRIKLEGAIEVQNFVTGKEQGSLSLFILLIDRGGEVIPLISSGSVIAVYGAEKNDGKFMVEEYCTAELPPRSPRKGPHADRFVLLASGLGLGGGNADCLLGLQLLVDMVTGQLGDEGEQSGVARISRVLLAGNLLSQSTQDKDSINKAKYLTKKTQAGSVEAIRMLDEILVQLAASVPVDLMPGEFDPTNYTLPQQPLHQCMFPLSSAYPPLQLAKYLTKKTQAGSVEAIRMLDEILVQLAASVPVDLMPGEFDPTNYTLPQQPLHQCMFPLSSAYPTLQLVSNPFQADIDGLRFLGTSGQNVSDIYKYSGQEDYIEILESTLRLSHLTPTAPDTLGKVLRDTGALGCPKGCYPFYQRDLFILEECPHVYFCGNAPAFQSKRVIGADGQDVLLVAIPEFSSTQTACLVNLRNLECQPISFSAFSAEAEEESEMDISH